MQILTLFDCLRRKIFFTRTFLITIVGRGIASRRAIYGRMVQMMTAKKTHNRVMNDKKLHEQQDGERAVQSKRIFDVSDRQKKLINFLESDRERVERNSRRYENKLSQHEIWWINIIDILYFCFESHILSCISDGLCCVLSLFLRHCAKV